MGILSEGANEWLFTQRGTHRLSKEGDAPATRHYFKTHYQSLATPYRRSPLLLTATRSSMTRASSASVKPLKKPLMVLALMQSPVSKPLAAPRIPQTEWSLCVKKARVDSLLL
ncbi:uncharacterized protein ACHE_11891S [Aspergillus chevalieri]|uniref:Uncharacterized protein n=1 Tax=Aspergillus chevalieri TaxID=182096 RepID=A0A7R7VIN3_ASPCH|nr:uncharacterized protein ACHE_11891S [Aspergillus chevalieri]BCR84489.1 hypothetical protein ACHE_11891S [Aspergillus chevalieri]